LRFVNEETLEMANGFLKGKTALVTGGARNLGRASAEMLARHGANVMVHYHGEKARADAEQTAALVRDAGGAAELGAAELSETTQVGSLFDRTITRRECKVGVLLHARSRKEHERRCGVVAR
jgi:NAD(P)-dependent dehydrogenase (short-subunit alcohol dehydrogenase family)